MFHTLLYSLSILIAIEDIPKFLWLHECWHLSVDKWQIKFKDNYTTTTDLFDMSGQINLHFGGQIIMHTEYLTENKECLFLMNVAIQCIISVYIKKFRYIFFNSSGNKFGNNEILQYFISCRWWLCDKNLIK